MIKPRRIVRRGVPQQFVNEKREIINLNSGRRWVIGRKHWDGGKRR